MSENKEAFLDRWSRLKQSEPDAKSAPPAEKEAEPVAPAAPLPDIDKLTPESDFRSFMNPKVDSGTRRDALKKLFVDPHYNIPDPFEPYSADLTSEDPISPEFLKTLNHARRLLFDEPENPASAAAATAETPQQTEAQPQEPDNVAGKQDA
jgi:Protein of unknown function (DUF3306)